jgi:hypothetical protein
MPVRPASRHVRSVLLMDVAIILLAIACIVVSAVLAWLWLSWRAEDRRAHDRAAARPRAGLITGGRPGRLCGGPDHPDWPLPPRR